jgi:transposase
MPTRAFVGLDVSQADAHVCFLLADGAEPGSRWTIPNTQPGAEALAHRLAQLAQQHAITELRIGMEATGLLWWHLAQYLRAAPVLAPHAPQVYALNPHLVTTFRANDGAIPKTDRVDAFLIAERLRFGRQLPAPFQLDARYAPLQRLTRFRLHLVQNLAREKHDCLSFLFLSFSGFGQASPFGDPFGTTSSAVLEEFTTEELAQQSLEALTAYLQEKGRGRFGDPSAVAATLQRAARDSYRLDRVLQEPLRLVLATTLATIRALQAQLKTLDATIARELAGLPQTLDTVPGLGPV